MIAPLQTKALGVQIGEARDQSIVGSSVLRRVGHRSSLRLSNAVRKLGREHHAAFCLGDRRTRSRFTDRTDAFDRPSEVDGASASDTAIE